MDAVYVDSNVVIGFPTKTPAHQYARALALMQRVSRGEVELLLSAAVVGEVAAVLHHSYELPQCDVAEQLIAFVSARGVNTEEPSIVLEALRKSGELKDGDFIAAVLAGPKLQAVQPVPVTPRSARSAPSRREKADPATITTNALSPLSLLKMHYLTRRSPGRDGQACCRRSLRATETPW